MKRNWTEKQKDAIDAREGNVLVSAAAGSGKTAVLVERVIERLTDKENPSSADRLLIVTFTRAAANEMRQRISAAVEDELRKRPGNSNLINQQMLLPSAKICTIDSFCASLVRENFQLLDISPDFKTADEGQLNILKAQAMELTLEQLYESENENFLNLVELLFKGRDDSNLSDMIYELYSASMSYPFPDKWLCEISQKYDSSVSLQNSVYGKIIMEYVKDALEYCLSIISSMQLVYEDWDDAKKAFESAVTSDRKQTEQILSYVYENNWDKTRETLSSYKAARRGNIPKELKDCPEMISLAESRDKVKSVLTDTLGEVMCCSEEEFIKDMSYLEPMVKELCHAANLFSQNFKCFKEEKGLADFNDIAHMALSLLVTPCEGDEFERTPLALSIAEDYDEILIDEYQDTNKAQDMLFTSISRNNLFRVGDVKQSIYRFRRAMPEIFISLKNAYENYDREKKAYPAKIVLGNNFRSRKSVTGAVNFVFSQLMSERVGDIDYGKEEELVFSAAYSEKNDESAELHVLQIDELDKDEQSSDDFQAGYVADLINRMICEGFTVKDGDGERRATYKDFCVLIRSVNGGRGAAYAKQMRKRNIPCFTEISANFFSSYEISLMLSLLRVIDNPKQDIPLMTVLMSVLFGFSVDEIAKIRINDRQSDIYGCLLSSKKNEKVSAFLEKISYLRTLSVSMGVEDFIREIYEDTALFVIVGAMSGAAAKKANLMLLLDYAATYEKAGYIGLSGFIGFIDRLERERQDLAGSVGLSADADVVKIMSIHKSKGLEFPVCIVANCAGLFNRSDEKSNMVISSKEGIGLVLRQTETLAQYPTVSHNAVKLSLRKDTVSEEMRVLYVAMTRAKEKLIMVGAVKKLDKLIAKCAVNINPMMYTSPPFAVSLASSYFEWLLTAFLRHEGAKTLRQKGGLDESIVLSSPFSLKVVLPSLDFSNEDETQKEKKESIDEEFLKLIEERCAYRYKYEPLTFAVSKRAASEVDEGAVDREYFASSKPAFLNKDGLTAAQRGTATHTFMQFANYEKASFSVKEEINRLCENGFISESEAKAINVKAVEAFFKSNFAKRILQSKVVMREKKFTVRVPIGEIYPSLSAFSDETVVIQGIADCAFVENGKLVVVDYKTDNLDSEEKFKEKYSKQVAVYKRALSLCTDYEVSETYLYSFRLEKEIKVEIKL